MGHPLWTWSHSSWRCFSALSYTKFTNSLPGSGRDSQAISFFAELLIDYGWLLEEKVLSLPFMNQRVSEPGSNGSSKTQRHINNLV